jgi:hypothetical protein
MRKIYRVPRVTNDVPSRYVPNALTILLRMVPLSLVLWQSSTILFSMVSARRLLQRRVTGVFPFDSKPIESNRHAEKAIREKHDRRVLVVAAVPRDERHVYSLWTSLECLATNVDHVVVSAPTWSKKIIGNITEFARNSIPMFSSGRVTLETQYHINDRYDVGLWCDALKAISNSDAYDEYGILNDSVFALREYTAVFDSLKSRNISMSSLSYSHTGKFFKGYGPEYFWVESVFRGLTREGLKTFMNYSCVDVNHPRFCADGSKNKRKECLILHFEQDMAAQFPRDKVDGLFFADVPSEMKIGKYRNSHTWVVHPPYWRKLVNEMQFPVAKENMNGMIDDLQDPLLAKCSRYLNRVQFENMIFDFSVAVSG